MQRDDEPHILASIEAARRALDEAEKNKAEADGAASRAKEQRDWRRRILNDRIVAATLADVPQKLIADNAGRSREAIRLAAISRVDPETIRADVDAAAAGDHRVQSRTARMAWMSAARRNGLEPLEIADENEARVGGVLVYDIAYDLVIDRDTVTAHRARKEG